jgi:hypothetical protein
MKFCRSCKQDKPSEAFYARYSVCKYCKNEQSKAWSLRNPDKVKQQRRKTRLKTKYGLTEESYAEMFNQQNGLCALCGETEPTKKLAVDHCHETGKLRKLLCTNCNTVLGKVHDNVDLLRKMVNYLDFYKENQN